MSSSFTALGAVVQGEVPEDYEESWDTVDGDNLPLGGFTCEAKWRVNGGTQVTRAGSVTTGTSTTTIEWEDGDYDDAGIMAGEVVVTDGTNTYKRSFQRVILPARGGV